MKKILTLVFLVFVGYSNIAQHSLYGKIVDQNNDPVAFATVFIEGTFIQTQANFDGNYQLSGLTNGNYHLIIQYVGLITEVKEVTIKDESREINFTLKPLSYISEEVIIEATRIENDQNGAYISIPSEDIEKQDFGQDLPFLLNQTPSVVVTSDAGAGIGYTGIRLRGSDPTRINVTINGIPMNDSESHSVYWVDIPDISSSTENIQIQRGVGSSTHGAGAFGGSINLLTNIINPKPYAKYSGTIGSFNTWKNSVSFGTGLVNKHWSFDGRISQINSEGFVDRASSDLKSYYLSAGYFTEKTMVKAIVFGGYERTYQAWNGVPEAKFNNDSLELATHISNNYQYTEDEVENLLNSSSDTYNFYSYKNQVDNYNQDHMQLHISHNISEKIKLNGAVHYTYGRGYYEQYKTKDDLRDYNLSPILTFSDSTDESDLIRRKWLDNDFYGFTGSLKYDNNNLIFTLGGAYNKYVGRHFGKVIWAQRAMEESYDHLYYNNSGFKTDGNIFTKVSYKFNDKLNLIGDIQLRSINYKTQGYDEIQTDLITDTSYTFINPKFAINYHLNNTTDLYAFVGIANREPVRSDFVDALDNKVPVSEQLIDYEIGVSKKFKNLILQVNGYYMDYKNQLINTGALNDVGDPIRTNVNKSSRKGVELTLALRVNSRLRLDFNTTLSKNKIQSFKEIIYDYTEGYDVIENENSNVDIAFSPNLIIGNSIEYSFLKHFNVSLFTKYVGKQYLDNTQSENKKLAGYLVKDVFLNYKKELKNKNELVLGIKIGNILNKKYASNGYTYSYVYNELITENFVYPQAGRNFMLKFGMSF